MKKDRFFYHSFPRPRQEDSTATLERGLEILRFMAEVGLILAPEVVHWDAGALSTNNERIQILQRRASFTELSRRELVDHARHFGPISLEFDIGDLRAAGALPVIYAPQSLQSSMASQVATFFVRGAWHTEKVLSKLQEMKDIVDPEKVKQKFGHPPAPNYELRLKNVDPSGKIINDFNVPAEYVRNFLHHVGYRNIPFDHSAAVLRLMMNMFYPTDNEFMDEQLGYYRQREWRLIETGVAFNQHPMTRRLNNDEQLRLQEIDRQFWTRNVSCGDQKGPRSELALLYKPEPNWNFLSLAKAIIVPNTAVERAREILGATAPIRSAQ